MAILAFAMTACTAISTATTTTTTVSGLREQLGMQFATTPYAGPVDEMCAASAAALVRDRYFGGTGPVDSLLWNNDIRVGPDCASAFLTAGFVLPTGTAGEAYRRVMTPGILPDGRLLISVDYGCENQWCLGGASYFVAKHGDQWVVEGDPITWIR